VPRQKQRQKQKQKQKRRRRQKQKQDRSRSGSRIARRSRAWRSGKSGDLESLEIWIIRRIRENLNMCFGFASRSKVRNDVRAGVHEVDMTCGQELRECAEVVLTGRTDVRM
jgi:hypothetical protein